jgi:hypothetical protein
MYWGCALLDWLQYVTFLTLTARPMVDTVLMLRLCVESARAFARDTTAKVRCMYSARLSCKFGSFW